MVLSDGLPLHQLTNAALELADLVLLVHLDVVQLLAPEEEGLHGGEGQGNRLLALHREPAATHHVLWRSQALEKLPARRTAGVYPFREAPRQKRALDR